MRINNQVKLETVIAKTKEKARQKKGHLGYIKEQYDCTDLEAKVIWADMQAGNWTGKIEKRGEEVHNMGKYTWNEANDRYIVPLKTYGDNFVITGAQHRALCNAYSTWGGKYKSLEEIGLLYGMTPDMIKEYMRIFNITRKSVPVTREELMQGNVSQAVERVMQTKKRAFDQEILHLDWKQTQAEATQWRALKAGEIDPFERLLDRYAPKSLPLTRYLNNNVCNDETLLIGLSDLHFGAKANEEELFAGKNFNSEKIRDIMDQYFQEINKEICKRRKAFKEVVVCSLGDILHGINGSTVKGTPLETDVLREEQYELALNCLILFFKNLLTLFKAVTVYSTKGNHGGVDDYILFKTIAIYFRNDSRIKFNLYKSRQACFKLGNTAILLEHGASDFTKSIMPASGSPKEAYVQSLFMEHPEVLIGVKSKLMLSGDRHHYSYDEMRGFDHVVFGSSVLGDRYSDALGLHSRARQNCLVLDENGVKESISFYFD